MFARAARRSVSLFRPRSAERDHGNDLEKTEAILATIDQLSGALVRERDGLRDRHEAAQARASTLLAALDGDAEGGKLSAGLAEMEAAMLYCERRTGEIDRLIAHFDSLREKTRAIADEVRGADNDA